MKIGIVGLGLIGGSLAKALKSKNKEYFIAALDKESVTKHALADGVIDKKLESIEELKDLQIVFLSTPTEISLSLLESLAHVLPKTSILTDVAGVKTVFKKKWEELSGKALYVGGHPMTGKEKSGYENSDPLLFENAVYILDNSFENDERVSPLLKIVHDLGAKVKFLEPRIHDMMIAYVSHLPQLVSVALTNVAAFKEGGIRFLDFAAGGFRDMTRIASSSFDIWESVLLQNQKEVSEALDSMISELDAIKENLKKGKTDFLRKKFENARSNRDEIPKDTKGFLVPLYDLFVFVKDEPGVIAKISTALFENGVNIKDIELLKIREGTGGTFRLSFDNKEEKEKAKKLLKNIGFKFSNP